ncbi:hypothetical protein G7074_14140 [Pedobacter sp. HDW13]|uniref:hypothetical protein n=1 Tax=Pedobacter sp. HDW13 TaxID=2714940 RepID=UPI00140C337E|nr:hypothetical protein [Pedobacter sp. HDW13]QIL40298.1 hypothetical protein G7074_14140 [Pedobacter sp. HDW13]
MKITLSLTPILCFITLLTNAQLKTLTPAKQMAKNGESMFEVSNKLNGDALIDRLVTQRRAFNNSRNKSASQLANLPAAEHIFDRASLTTITFEGLDYFILNNRVIGIKGLALSNEVLAQITDKLMLLDKVQYDYCEKANNEYLSANTNFQNIRNMDRWFFTTLKIFNTTVNDIASFTKNATPSLSVAANISKMTHPNIDAWKEKQIDQALVQLEK